MFQYESIPGFFSQDNPSADPAGIGAVPPRFGLTDVTESRWSTLMSKLQELNATGDGSHKLVFFGRHGQGYHNVAEEKYGTKAWDDHWAMLNGDDEITWGPDPELTTLGKDQPAAVHAVWKEECGAGLPLPDKLYCSPLTRAIQTNIITFADMPIVRPVILESCREEYGQHTCDKRSTRAHIHTTFPQFDIENGFEEDDPLWTAETRETRLHAASRARTVLDRIFTEDKNATVVSVTAHGGIINGFLQAIGRAHYSLPTGGVLPIVIKATRVPTSSA